MSSYLEKSKEAFKNSVSSAASKVSNKRTLAALPISAPSPALSNSSTTSKGEKGDSKELKRKREQNVVYSQPADSGFGEDAFTQVTYLIDYLKKKSQQDKDEPIPLLELLKYIGKNNHAETYKRTIASILRKHGRVEWIPDSNAKTQSWDSGTFRHRPLIRVRNKTDLLAYLQKRPDAQGVSVKDLKDGWVNCEESINELEDEHKVLVTRTKKDNHARMVWANDPSLVHPVDDEFKIMWHKTELPGPDELVRKLLDAGQKTASEDPAKRVKLGVKQKEKKRKASKRAGRTTNKHMEHLLKDYSSKKL